ncbi:hypothetical protein SCARD494_01836 [Seiridium cardinale]
MRILCEQELVAMFLSHNEPGKVTNAALEELYEVYGTRLQVIANAVKADLELSEEEISLRLEDPRNKKPTSAEDETKGTSPDADNYKTEAASRNLAMDQETGDIIFEINTDVMMTALGYESIELTAFMKEQFVVM